MIVPSQTTKKHVEDLYGVAPEKITIVPEGAPRSFAPVEDEGLLTETRLRYLGEDVHMSSSSASSRSGATSRR